MNDVGPGDRSYRGGASEPTALITVVREIPNRSAIRAFGTPSAASLLISAQSSKVITPPIVECSLFTAETVQFSSAVDKLLGIGRTLAYELIRTGEWPTPTLRIGRLIKIPPNRCLTCSTTAPHERAGRPTRGSIQHLTANEAVGPSTVTSARAARQPRPNRPRRSVRPTPAGDTRPPTPDVQCYVAGQAANAQA